VQYHLGLYKQIPPNGLAIFAGEKTIIFEPYKLLKDNVYECDSCFHTELLRKQLCDAETYGCIIIDGDEVSFHTICGHVHETIYQKRDVNLPKKHGKGGQSKQRFERIREQKRGW
jgi:peptide chain release factor subunit 1